MGFKRTFACILALMLSFSCVYGGELDGLSREEQAQAAGAYIEEIVNYIKQNYIGNEVSTEDMIKAAAEAIVGQLDDYSAFLPQADYDKLRANESMTWFAPDFNCEFDEDGYPRVVAITKNSLAYIAGLRMNDYITNIDGITTYGIGEEEYNELVSKTSVGSIHIKVKSGNDSADFDVQLKRVVNRSVVVKAMSSFDSAEQRFDDKEVGYIQILSFSKNTSVEFAEAIEQLKKAGVKKLILDLRGNSGGYVDEAIAVCRQIVPKGVIISTKDKNGTNTTYNSDLAKTPFEKNVILVDENTASASEIVASAMQDSGAAKIVGTQTFGKGIMQSVMDFEGLGVIKMTTLEYSTRLGRQINEVGITPDIRVDKVIFLETTDALDSDKVVSAIRFLGYKVDANNTVARDLGRYQAEMKLPVTYKLDNATVSAINMEIYERLSSNDRVLTAGYLNLLS